jgi:multiple sugar transport system substrate-binding protein
MSKIRNCFAVMSIAGAVFLSGCGAGKPSSESASSDISDKPVTITMSIDQGIDEDFLTQIQEQVQKEHPNITLEYIRPGKGTSLAELVAANQTPDLVLTYNGKVASYRDLGLLYDMTPLLKLHSFDLSRFDSAVLEDAKIASTNDELFGIPISLNFHALYYNKDIFDKYGAPYPTDGMTWDQVLQLAKKVTGMDNGTKYRGFDPGNFIWVSQPLGIAAVDPQTDKASVNNDQWKKVFELVKAFYSIPGNEPIEVPAKDQFLKEKTLAMYTDLSIFNDLELATQNGLNWDVVQYPSYPEKPNIYGNASVNMLMITSTSPHKEQALQVISAAVSDEVQLLSARKGRITPLKDAKFREEFGADREVLKGKNLQGIFKSKPVKYPIASKYRSKAENMVRNKFTEYLKGQVDVNTALAQLDEEINKMIEAESFK